MILHLLRLKNVSIYDQLLLEERLLREDQRNFCIFNEGSPSAIVMGISGKPQELVDFTKLEEAKTPLIQRFSGGGTVIVDENTLFVSFLCNKEEFSFPAYPEKIMKWTEGVYQEAFGIREFALRENDFVIGDHKCGGNAQYIKKERWLQHTSFLWDFCPVKMSSLLLPKKTPPYRQGRSHQDFLCTLKERFVSKGDFFSRIAKTLTSSFSIIPIDHEELTSSFSSSSEGRRQTRLVELASFPSR